MRVAFLDTVHKLLTDKFINVGWQVDQLDHLSQDEIEKIIHNYEGIVLRSRFKINASFLQKATKLKFIGRPGAGLENIDIEFCDQNSVSVFRSPEGNRDAVAEHAIGMLLMLFNNLKKADSEVRSGIWNREENRGFELMGKTIGLVGYGFMGAAIAQRFSGFGVKVIAYDKYKSNYSSSIVQEVTEQELFDETDVLSLHLPQTEETIGLVNKAYLNRFSKTIYLINTARGKSVVLADLNDAIKEGTVKGACLDVLEVEKSSFENTVDTKSNSALKELLVSNKVLFSPHIAGWTFAADYKMADFLSEKILDKFN